MLTLYVSNFSLPIKTNYEICLLYSPVIVNFISKCTYAIIDSQQTCVHWKLLSVCDNDEMTLSIVVFCYIVLNVIPNIFRLNITGSILMLGGLRGAVSP